ncbi:S-methyl-5-thioribose kinase [Rheinheimera sp. WS51]|uniref:S-methyl-5-thioribose kinase n=1 Tax=Rheinheimera sp. WS51 TaxID=3425886 RepID=UPI003D92816D
MAEYHTFTSEDAKQFADEHSGLFGSHSKLQAEKLTEKNFNQVFRVSNDKGSSLIVKQALPYAGYGNDNWPLTVDRARIEAEVLQKHHSLCPDHTVEVLHHDTELACILLEDLDDYRLLRTELIAAKSYPHLAPQMAKYFAHTLYHTSDFALTGPNKKQQVIRYLNPELCLISEDIIFTEPYFNHESNHVPPGMQQAAQALWADQELKAEVAQLKVQFLSAPQALLHGDLNISSIFINDENCKVIDAEFGFYGPMGFDIGSLIGSILLNYIAHFALTEQTETRQAHQSYLLEQSVTLWQHFSQAFQQLLTDKCTLPLLSNNDYQHYFIQQLFADCIGFAGCELIRRAIGVARIADFEQISSDADRNNCKTMALNLGQALIMQRKKLTDIQQFQQLVEQNSLINIPD